MTIYRWKFATSFGIYTDLHIGNRSQFNNILTLLPLFLVVERALRRLGVTAQNNRFEQ